MTQKEFTYLADVLNPGPSTELRFDESLADAEQNGRISQYQETLKQMRKLLEERDLSNIELWELGNEGDEGAIEEIKARGFDVVSFLNRPLSELL